MLFNYHFHDDGTVTRKLEDGSHAVQLARPVKWGGRVMSEVVVRVPTARDMVRLTAQRGADYAVGIAIAAVLTDLPRAVVDKLDAADFNKVVAAVGDSFAAGGRRK